LGFSEIQSFGVG